MPQTAVRIDGRERILNEATRLFAELGYEGASLSAIAEAAGMRKPSLLYHFDSKESLRHAVMAHFLDHWKEVLPAILERTRGGEDRFSALMGACIDFLTEDPNRAKLFVRAALDHPEELSAQLKAQLTPWLGLVSSAIEDGKRSGVVGQDVDADAFILQAVRLAMAQFAMPSIAAAFMAQPDKAQERSLNEMLRMGRAALFTSPREA